MGVISPFAGDDRSEIDETECQRIKDEGVGVVADGGGFAPIGVGLVRFLRHLGSPSRRLLPNHQICFGERLGFVIRGIGNGSVLLMCAQNGLGDGFRIDVGLVVFGHG
ncbi:hypothetical protein AKJ16_DCAP07081 [Drosera capensis]